MKANRFAKLARKNKGALDLQQVGILSAFFIVIIITVMIFWNIATSVPEIKEQTESFSITSTTSNQTFTLSYSKVKSDTVTVEIYNGSATTPVWRTLTSSDFTVNEHANTVTVLASALATNDTIAKITYKTYGAVQAGNAETMFSTVFGLLPILGLVIVASLIIAVVIKSF